VSFGQADKSRGSREELLLVVRHYWKLWLGVTMLKPRNASCAMDNVIVQPCSNSGFSPITVEAAP
jgi:hypothetical protein